MHVFVFLVHLVSAGAGLVSAIPAPSRASQLYERAESCTFTDAAKAIESKTSCSTITLKNIKVPGGETLDLTDLNDDTRVHP